MKANPPSLIVSERVLFCGQMQASARLVYSGNFEQYELDTQTAGEVPMIFKGSLRECLQRGQMFVDRKISEGWALDMPLPEPMPIN